MLKKLRDSNNEKDVTNKDLEKWGKQPKKRVRNVVYVINHTPLPLN